MVHRYRKKMGGVHFIAQIRSGPSGLHPTAFSTGLAQTLGAKVMEDTEFGDVELTEEMNPNGSTVTTRRMSTSARDNALRVLFTLALAWVFLFGMMALSERTQTLVEALNPASEGSSLHTVWEDWAPVFVAVVAASIFSALVVRFKPQFLSVPREVSSLRLWGTLIVTTTIVGIALLVILVAVTVILDPPGSHLENVQYISLVFWLPPLAVAVITPIAGILIAWGWMIHRSPG